MQANLNTERTTIMTTATATRSKYRSEAERLAKGCEALNAGCAEEYSQLIRRAFQTGHAWRPGRVRALVPILLEMIDETKTDI